MPYWFLGAIERTLGVRPYLGVEGVTLSTVDRQRGCAVQHCLADRDDAVVALNHGALGAHFSNGGRLDGPTSFVGQRADAIRSLQSCVLCREAHQPSYVGQLMQLFYQQKVNHGA